MNYDGMNYCELQKDLKIGDVISVYVPPNDKLTGVFEVTRKWEIIKGSKCYKYIAKCIDNESFRSVGFTDVDIGKRIFKIW